MQNKQTLLQRIPTSWKGAALAVVIIAIVGLVMVSGDSRTVQAQSANQGGITVTLSFSEMLELMGAFLNGFQQEPQETLGSIGTRFPNGISIGTTTAVSTPGELIVDDAATFHSDISLTGRLTMGAVIVATTTETGTTAATLVEADWISTDYHVVDLGGAEDADFTYTITASSSMTNVLSRVGQRTSQHCFFLISSSTSLHDLIFAAGTGIDIVVASTTDTQIMTTALVLDEGEEGCFTFRMKPRDDGIGAANTVGDITAIFEAYEDAD